MSLALRLLQQVCPEGGELQARHDAAGRASTVLRYDVCYQNDSMARESITFVSTPYMLLREKLRHREADSMKSLLHFHYDYDAGDGRDDDQVIRQSRHASDNEIINVALLRCLLVGSGTLVSACDWNLRSDRAV